MKAKVCVNFLSLQNINARKSVVISLGGSDILNLTSFLCSSIAQACPEIDIYFTAPKHFCVKNKEPFDYKNIFHRPDSFHDKMPLVLQLLLVVNIVRICVFRYTYDYFAR